MPIPVIASLLLAWDQKEEVMVHAFISRKDSEIANVRDNNNKGMSPEGK